MTISNLVDITWIKSRAAENNNDGVLSLNIPC